ncbi:hypothetical protein KKA15_04620 [Patescibacteria group bacterium]|nr:hypothetical protein [Patescibacteria group bacterium]
METEPHLSEEDLATEKVELTGNAKFESVAYSISQEGEEYVIRRDLNLLPGVEENDATKEREELLDNLPTLPLDRTNHPSLKAAKKALEEIIAEHDY